MLVFIFTEYSTEMLVVYKAVTCVIDHSHKVSALVISCKADTSPNFRFLKVKRNSDTRPIQVLLSVFCDRLTFAAKINSSMHSNFISLQESMETSFQLNGSICTISVPHDIIDFGTEDTFFRDQDYLRHTYFNSTRPVHGTHNADIFKKDSIFENACFGAYKLLRFMRKEFPVHVNIYKRDAPPIISVGNRYVVELKCGNVRGC